MVRKHQNKGKGSSRDYSSKSGRESGNQPAISVASRIAPSKPLITLDSSSIVGTPLSALLQAQLALVPPNDGDEQSVTKAANEIYARIRAMNAGAVNYDEKYIISYLYQLRHIRACLIQMVLLWHSAKVKLPDFVDYPTAMFAACGGNKYQSFVQSMADTYNELLNLCEDVDLLPHVPIDLFAKDIEVLGTVVKESHSGRSSYIAPVMYRSTVTVWNGTAWTIANPTFTTSESRYADLRSSLVTYLKDLVGSSVFAILRGDMMKAFGAAAYDQSMTALLKGGFRIADDARYRGMYHCATFLGVQASGITVSTASGANYPEFATIVDGTSKIPHVTEYWMGDTDSWDDMVADWLTRLAPRMTTISTNTKYTVYPRGWLLGNINAITTINYDSAPTVQAIRTFLSNAQTSTVQSTAVNSIIRITTFSMLAPSIWPKMMFDDDSNLNWECWAMDNPYIITMTDYQTLMSLLVRQSFNARPLVFSKARQETV